jgi:radical SAM superfamily enzyme YgiQ (UPF0313 family)
VSDHIGEIKLAQAHYRKVLLCGINLWQRKKAGKKYFSLALYYLKSFAEKDPAIAADYQISVVDFFLTDLDDQIASAIIKEEPEIIGFSAFFWNIQKIQRIAVRLKNSLKNVLIIAGGPEVSGDPESVLQGFPHLDIIVVGEGEMTFSELLKAMMRDKPDLRTVVGIAFRWQNEITRNPDRPLLSCLDQIPSPFLQGHINCNPDEFFSLLETFRGCPYQCAYCGWGNKKVRFYSAERIKQEILWLVEHGVREIILLDSDIGLNKKFFGEVLSWVLEKAIPVQFASSVRVELLDLGAPSVFASFSQGLFSMIELGLQSIGEAPLKYVHRVWPREIFEKKYFKLKNLPGRTFALIVDLIYGLPGDDYLGLKKSIKYVLDTLRPEKLQLFPLRVFPGTRLRRQADEFGLQFVPDGGLVLENNSFSRGAVENARRLEISNHYLMKFMEYIPSVYGAVLREVNGNKFRLLELVEEYFSKNPEQYILFSRASENISVASSELPWEDDALLHIYREAFRTFLAFLNMEERADSILELFDLDFFFLRAMMNTER